MKNKLIQSFKRLGAGIGVIATLMGGWAGYLRLSGNFHTVDEGVVYRSGQLSGRQFSVRIHENGIRTIINLRGNNVGSAWYDDELKASEVAGVTHIDFPISARHELTDQQIVQLAGLFATSPRPILIHCEAGADRTGFASALYRLVIDRRSASEAGSQLSFRYGHFPWLGTHTDAMDKSFARAVSQMPLT